MAQTSSITLEPAGTRIYIAGNTYPVKDRLRAAGAHWDGERKQWWIGVAKRAEIESLVSSVPVQQPATAASATDAYDGEVRGKVSYTSKAGKTGTYYVRWAGTTSRGTDAVRLTNLAGTVDFWADASSVQWTKRYEQREQRGAYGRGNGRYEYPTLWSIRRFVADKRQIQQGGDCPRCADREARGLQRAYYGSGDYDDCTLCGATYGEV